MAAPDLVQIDPDKLTMQEVVDIEDYTGISIEDWNLYRWPGHPRQRVDEDGEPLRDGYGNLLPPLPNLPKRVIIAMLWIAGRRDDPTYTLQQAGAVTIEEMNATPTVAASTALEPLPKPIKTPVRKRSANAA